MVGELLVTIRAKPGSSRDRIGSTAGSLVVAVTAPAVDGRANEAVVRVLAKALHLRTGLVSVKSGARSRIKVISIEVTAESAPVITERLAALLGGSGAP